MSLSGMHNTLAAIARAQRLAPKWLIAPSLRIGHQWVERIVRQGQSVINLHVATVRTLALNLAGPRLTAERWTVVDPMAAAMIAGNLWEQHGQIYLGALSRTPALDRAIHASLVALRTAGLAVDQIDQAAFEVAEKSVAIRQLLQAYESELRRLQLVDHADVLRVAIERVTTDPSALAAEALVLIPDDLEWRGLERRFLENIPSSNVCRFSHVSDVPQARRDTERLSHYVASKEFSGARGDGTVQLFRSIGTANEIREVFRRCIRAGIPLDDVEVLHTDNATYVPVLYEIASLVAPQGTAERLPVTFAEGIPASYSRPGRALTAWLQWIEQDYLQQHLVRMIHDGLLHLSASEEISGFTGLASILRHVGIGWGRSRYPTQLCEQRKTLELSLLESQSQPNADPAVVEAKTRRYEGIKLIEKLVQRLFELSPEAPQENDPVLLDNAIRFLQQSVRCVTQVDHVARERLIEQIERLRRGIAFCGNRCPIDVLAWLKALPSQTTILESGPRPGCVHVAHLLSGGHSGRRYTFIVGLDDSRFPAASTQDPILLDSERQRLSTELTVSGDQLRQRLQCFSVLLKQLSGDVTLSYSCHDLLADRELFPSSVILAAYRLLSGDRDADQKDLEQLTTVSFAADAADKALDEGEWWLWKLTGREAVRDAATVVQKRFPHLGRGMFAASQRASTEITAFDGWVPAAGRNYDPSVNEKPLSASALETVGRCPLKYFFRYPLNVRPPEELTLDVERWLDPLQFGSLLHEVFRIFFTELTEQGQLPDYQRDEQRLAQILVARVQEYRSRVPPPNEPAFRRQFRQLRRAAKVFLVSEAEHCKTSSPEFFEASIGLPSEGSLSQLDCEEPVTVPLPNGGELRACGRIDRIDRLSENEFAIWDYKTGSSYSYNPAKPFQQGRLIQNALYVAIVEAVLRDKVSPQARVTSFGYFFPGEREWGQRICWEASALFSGLEVLDKLCQIIRGGAFLPTDKKDDCQFCDYQMACGDISSLTQSSAAKLDHLQNLLVEPMRSLRREAAAK